MEYRSREREEGTEAGGVMIHTFCSAQAVAPSASSSVVLTTKRTTYTSANKSAFDLLDIKCHHVIVYINKICILGLFPKKKKNCVVTVTFDLFSINRVSLQVNFVPNSKMVSG